MFWTNAPSRVYRVAESGEPEWATLGFRLGSFSALVTIDFDNPTAWEPGATDREPRPTNSAGSTRKSARRRAVIVTNIG